jgi:transcriptional regulator with XRE-family HTH domain
LICYPPNRPRREARLLTPDEIRDGREKLGLTQKQFANLLGVGEATVSRWETGAQIQQRAMDRFLRVCLASPAAVAAFAPFRLVFAFVSRPIASRISISSTGAKHASITADARVIIGIISG